MTSLALNIQQIKLNSSFLHQHQEVASTILSPSRMLDWYGNALPPPASHTNLLNPSQDNVKKGFISTNSIYFNSYSVPVSLESCSSALSWCLITLYATSNTKKVQFSQYILVLQQQSTPVSGCTLSVFSAELLDLGVADQQPTFHVPPFPMDKVSWNWVTSKICH